MHTPRVAKRDLVTAEVNLRAATLRSPSCESPAKALWDQVDGGPIRPDFRRR